jgi:hypothetical protein
MNIQTPHELVNAIVAEYGISANTSAFIFNPNTQSVVPHEAEDFDGIVKIFSDNDDVLCVVFPWETYVPQDIVDYLADDQEALDVLALDAVGDIWKSLMCQDEECCSPDGMSIHA